MLSEPQEFKKQKSNMIPVQVLEIKKLKKKNKQNMSEVQVKFFSTDRILFQEQSKAEAVVKDDLQTYVIKINVHHIDILENKN